ncbi:hypothetical protein GE061_017103, partial [Apolygus lucorum]
MAAVDAIRMRIARGGVGAGLGGSGAVGGGLQLRARAGRTQYSESSGAWTRSGRALGRQERDFLGEPPQITFDRSGNRDVGDEIQRGGPAAVGSECGHRELLRAGRCRQVAAALLDSVAGRVVPVRPSLSCPLCQWIPFVPVTLPAGTRRAAVCLEAVTRCPECAAPVPLRADTNVLLKAAVAKWWAPESEAARIKVEGDLLLRSNCLERALDKYNTALRI